MSFLKVMSNDLADRFGEDQVAALSIAVKRPPYGVVGDPVPTGVLALVDHVENLDADEVVCVLAMSVGASLYKAGQDRPTYEQFQATSQALSKGWQLAQFLHENGAI